MTKFFMAVLLALHFSLGNAELEGEEDISEFLYDYASRFSDYLYATVEYYSENSTILPTTYSYGEYQGYLEYQEYQESQESQESVGSALRCHIPILILSLLGFLL
ncbi:uncharacterized protein ACIB01_018608 isoform 1-T1 [Guaruba guarouba]